MAKRKCDLSVVTHQNDMDTSEHETHSVKSQQHVYTLPTHAVSSTTTERDWNWSVMTVKDRKRAQIKENGFVLLLSALEMLESEAYTCIVIQILGDMFATRNRFM